VSGSLYFRQLLSGRDFARDDAWARRMANFVYAVGDRDAGVAVLVDPAYAPLELVELVGADGLTVVGAVATHYHADHVGGTFAGVRLAGVVELLDALDVPVHVQCEEVEWITRGTGLDASALTAHASGERVEVGGVSIGLVHTPGHTPGSQCLMVEGRLVTGDTLFLEGCGRTDLPGSDPDEMYVTLHERLAAIADDALVYAGHDYSTVAFAPLGEVRATNPVLASVTADEWRAAFAP